MRAFQDLIFDSFSKSQQGVFDPIKALNYLIEVHSFDSQLRDISITHIESSSNTKKVLVDLDQTVLILDNLISHTKKSAKANSTIELFSSIEQCEEDRFLTISFVFCAD